MIAKVLCRWAFCLALLSPLLAGAQQTSSDTRLSSRPLYQSLQQALDTLAQAEIAREEAALTSQQPETLRSAREQCRAAITQLNSLDDKLTTLLRESYRVRPSQRPKNSWTVQELESLARNLKVQLARAYRNQALCYPDGNVDRLNSLSLAKQQLAEVTMQPLDDASVWRARVEQVVCLRLLKKYLEAEKLIETWQAENPPTIIASRLQGEQLRIELDRNNLKTALQLADALEKTNPSHVPETDDAVLEAVLAAVLSVEGDHKSRLLERALSQLQQISATHGPFWQRRAEIRLGQTLAAQAESDDPKLLDLAAAALYASGKSQQAVSLYDQIATLHAAKGEVDQEFQALKTAAAIVNETDQSDAARQRFRQLALDHPAHEQAAAMHLTAIGLAAQSAQNVADEQRSKAFEGYLVLLNEHLQHWPDRSTAKTVKQWLAQTKLPAIERERAKTLAQQGQRDQALALYRKLVELAPNDADLLEQFAKQLADGDEKSDMQDALRFWQQIEKRSKPGSPRWWRGRRARLALLKQLGEGEQAQKLEQLTKILYPAGINDE